MIESAKREYHEMMNLDAEGEKGPFSGLCVFTMGDDNGVPYRINPFEKAPGVALQTHIFALDGRLVAQRNFVGSTDITLARGCYVVVLRDEKGLNYANLKVLVR